MRQLFSNIFEQTVQHLSQAPENQQFFDTEHAWDKHYRVLKHATAHNHMKGLDFGPGTGASLIVADLLGMDVQGFDIAHTKDGRENKFLYCQKHLNSIGLKTTWSDSDIHPWPFPDNEFEFILCWDSLFTDWLLWEDFKDTDPRKATPRLNEMMRILKPAGAIYIGCKKIQMWRQN